MMDALQQLLQISAKLYQFLEFVPKGEKRDDFIKSIHLQLDERGKLMDLLREDGFQVNKNNKAHVTLMKLDKGIRHRLEMVMQEVKDDLKTVQKTKKNEKQYMNPYSSVRVMDGMYYDKKK